MFVFLYHFFLFNLDFLNLYYRSDYNLMDNVSGLLSRLKLYGFVLTLESNSDKAKDFL